MSAPEFLSNLRAGLAEEFEAIAQTSRKTRPSRAVIAAVGALLLVVPLTLAGALSWLTSLCALEAALHLLSKRIPQSRTGSSLAIAALGLVLLGIGLTWSAVPVIFVGSGDLGLQFAGMAILMAQLIDVQAYTFRLKAALWILGGVPLCVLVILPFSASVARHEPAPNLVILAFCLICTAAYFAAAIRQNRITAERLEASNLAAEAANRAKSAFVAMISHELRTPMNAVIGLAHALKKSASSAERDEHVDLIIRSSEGLMVLLNDILDLSKFEAGKLHIETQAFDLRNLAAELQDLWRPLADSKGLEFDVTLDPDTAVWVLGDAGRLRQVLGNLLSNAIKFTAEGRVTLRITTAAPSPGWVDITAEVEDTGIGLRPEEEARLFQPFSQANEATGSLYGGTGLGLSISQGLAELMGGALRCKSRAGVGSTFQLSVSLPSTEACIREDQQADDMEILTKRRILVVDDNHVNLIVAESLLTSFGVDVATAASGAEAIEILLTSRVDLVLLDLHMPHMTGTDVLRRIRAGEAGSPGVPVVACTADALTGNGTSLLELGFDAVQTKPIVPRELAETLARALAVRGAQQVGVGVAAEENLRRFAIP